MALTIFIMLFFSIILAIRNYRNRYCILFILMVLGMALSIFSIILEIGKNSNYLVSTYIYSGFDYRLFMFFSHIIRPPMSNILAIRDLGTVTYLVAIFLFANVFNKSVISSRQKQKSASKYIRNILLILYPILYIMLYNSNTAFKLYLIRYSFDSVEKQHLWMNFIFCVDYLMSFTAFVYLIYPIIFLIRNLIRNRITFFSEQLLGLAVSLSMLNSIFYIFFFTGSFKNSVGSVFQTSFWWYKITTVIPRSYTTLMPILSLVILAIILFITFRFKTNTLLYGIRERAIKKNLDLLNNNLKDVLHSDKNIMFNFKILAEEAINNYGNEEGLESIKKILSISSEQIADIAKALDNIRALKVRTLKNNLIDAIEVGISRVYVPEHIKLTKVYNSLSANSNFDMYHMTQVFANLLSNSVDAINSREGTEAEITITVDSSTDWIYFSLKDNGCGIPKKVLKKIFDPYFSTKSKQNNWGIGLSYVFRVITAHYGHIRIRSRQGEFTIVEILLPRK